LKLKTRVNGIAERFPSRRFETDFRPISDFYFAQFSRVEHSDADSKTHIVIQTVETPSKADPGREKGMNRSLSL
jgi:hypothetical protein